MAFLSCGEIDVCFFLIAEIASLACSNKLAFLVVVNLSTESDIELRLIDGSILIRISRWLGGELMVLIILLRIAVKTTTNCCNDVSDAGSCWPLRAAS